MQTRKSKTKHVLTVLQSWEGERSSGRSTSWSYTLSVKVWLHPWLILDVLSFLPFPSLHMAADRWYKMQYVLSPVYILQKSTSSHGIYGSTVSLLRSKTEKINIIFVSIISGRSCCHSGSYVDSLWPHGLQASLYFTVSQSLLKFMSIESVMPCNHLILCCPLLLLLIFPIIRVFSNVLALYIRWPRYGSFSISPSNDFSGLISFRNKWLDLLAVQETLKSLLQHYSSKASVVWSSASLWCNSHIHTLLLEKP